MHLSSHHRRTHMWINKFHHKKSFLFITSEHFSTKTNFSMNVRYTVNSKIHGRMISIKSQLFYSQTMSPQNPHPVWTHWGMNKISCSSQKCNNNSSIFQYVSLVPTDSAIPAITRLVKVVSKGITQPHA
jgi:hypothetical protein